ncbi:hypothetical protein RN001_015524 [Aquatica leii]|uniref:Uncharacterized protein n=1 Tax=Aquatica leii TaxID=1421715 RepID=A0AAN7SNJ1_9COLE|nr:hypothetical protein RN001_015524 [Aquatica leii]
MRTLFGIIFLVSSAYCDNPFTVVFRPHVSFCECETGVNVALVGRFFQNKEFSNDACLRCFFKCLLQKMEFLRYDGTISVADIILKLEISEEPILHCVSQVQNETDLCIKAFLFLKCLLTDIEICIR